jgi:hypothetical protein
MWMSLFEARPSVRPVGTTKYASKQSRTGRVDHAARLKLTGRLHLNRRSCRPGHSARGVHSGRLQFTNLYRCTARQLLLHVSPSRQRPSVAAWVSSGAELPRAQRDPTATLGVRVDPVLDVRIGRGPVTRSCGGETIEIVLLRMRARPPELTLRYCISIKERQRWSALLNVREICPTHYDRTWTDGYAHLLQRRETQTYKPFSLRTRALYRIVSTSQTTRVTSPIHADYAKRRSGRFSASNSHEHRVVPSHDVEAPRHTECLQFVNTGWQAERVYPPAPLLAYVYRTRLDVSCPTGCLHTQQTLET